MNVILEMASRLPSGTASFPGEAPSRDGVVLRLGAIAARVRATGGSPAGRLRLAPDVWKRLAVPYESIALQMRETGPYEVELGPVVGVLWPGKVGRCDRRRARERAALYFGHRAERPGLLAIGFDESIDWERGRMDGYVVDNRPGGEGRVVRAWFPIPAAVHLTWSILREVIDRLREATGERTFNWVRSIGKWQQHRLLSEVAEVAPHLPETRVLGSPVDLAAMLARFEQVFVKHVHSIQGQRVARVRRLPEGLEVRHMDQGRLVEERFADPVALMPYLREALGAGRLIVQRGLNLTGREGRALDFRVVVVRERGGGWRCPVVTANVTPDDRVVFANVANGATDEDAVESLERHLGMGREQAEASVQAMVRLCIRAAEALQEPYHPLGILGFDVGVEADSHRLWLLEANSVPGWGYPEPIEEDLARSQVEYGVALTGFAAP